LSQGFSKYEKGKISVPWELSLKVKDEVRIRLVWDWDELRMRSG